MTQGIKIVNGILIVGVLAMYSTIVYSVGTIVGKHSVPVIMIQSWHDEDQNQIDVKLGNGLDDAIQKCAEHDGTTSLQGHTTQELTCYVDGVTYVYRYWEWEADSPIKLD